MELHKCKVSKHETTQHTFTSVYYSTVYTCTWLLSVQEVVKLIDEQYCPYPEEVGTGKNNVT